MSAGQTRRLTRQIDDDDDMTERQSHLGAGHLNHHLRSIGPRDILHMAGLTTDQLASFQRDGYLVIPDYLSPSTVETLHSKTRKLLQDFDLASHPMTRFSTGSSSADAETDKENDGHIGDSYFLESNDKIRFFFEEGAFDRSTGQLTVPQSRAINKIGHALHDLDPDFRALSSTRELADIAHSLGFHDPRVLQSMVICKQPEIGAALPSHQDSTFLYTDPPSAIGFWFALEDATGANGCLSFSPGSHLTHPITRRFIRHPTGSGTTFETIPSHTTATKETEAATAAADFQLAECRAGSLVLIHGNVLHKSKANTSRKSRFIYTFHVIEGAHRYDEKNWLQPTAKGFTKLAAS